MLSAARQASAKQYPPSVVANNSGMQPPLPPSSTNTAACDPNDDGSSKIKKLIDSLPQQSETSSSDNGDTSAPTCTAFVFYRAPQYVQQKEINSASIAQAVPGSIDSLQPVIEEIFNLPDEQEQRSHPLIKEGPRETSYETESDTSSLLFSADANPSAPGAKFSEIFLSMVTTITSGITFGSVVVLQILKYNFVLSSTLLAATNVITALAMGFALILAAIYFINRAPSNFEKQNIYLAA